MRERSAESLLTLNDLLPGPPTLLTLQSTHALLIRGFNRLDYQYPHRGTERRGEGGVLGTLGEK
jgi:hypothetical protein